MLVKFDSQSTLTPLFTQLFLSFQESPGIGDRTKRKRKFHSVETRLEVDASSYIYIYISPPRPSSSPLNRLLRKRSSVPASCNSDSAGRNSRLPKFFRLLVREFLAQSCQAAVLMKRYRRWKPSRSPRRGFERRDIGEIPL